MVPPSLQIRAAAGRWSWRVLLAVALLTTSLTCVQPARSAPGAVISLDPSTRYQTISGWEATAQAGQDDAPRFPEYRDGLFDQAAFDLGINRLRIELISGTENPVDSYAQLRSGLLDQAQWKKSAYEIVNDNDDPYTANPDRFHFTKMDATIDNVVTPMRNRLAARNEHLYVVLNYVDFGTSRFEHKDRPDEYAELILQAFRHTQEKYGWTPDAVEMILEPDNAAWTARQIGAAIVATEQRLSSEGFRADFIAPSTTDMGMSISMFDQMIQMEGVLPRISELSYHRYRNASDANLQAIGARARQYGIDTAMLEHIGSGYQDLHADLSVGMVSAWQQYTLAYPTGDNGAQYYVIAQTPGGVQAVPGSRTWFLRQYFRYIRAGAVRIGASSGQAAWDPLAFVNANGSWVVVIKCAGAGSFQVQGLPAGTFRASYTTTVSRGIELGAVTIRDGDSFEANMPGSGVFTIYGESPPAGTP